MADIDWPPDLPQCPGRGWRMTFQDVNTRSSPDVGPGAVRAQMSRAPRIFSAPYPKLTTAQRQALETFWHDTLIRGSLPFNWPHPRDAGVSIEVRIWSYPDVPEIAGGYHSATIEFREI